MFALDDLKMESDVQPLATVAKLNYAQHPAYGQVFPRPSWRLRARAWSPGGVTQPQVELADEPHPPAR